PAGTSPVSLHDALPIWPVGGIQVAEPLVQAFAGASLRATRIFRLADLPAHDDTAGLDPSLDARCIHRTPPIEEFAGGLVSEFARSEEHTSELQSRENLV